MPNPNVVVFYTNVILPLLVPASRSTHLLNRLKTAGWRVAASPQILAEVEDKLRTKESLRKWLDVTDQDIDEFIDEDLPAKMIIVPGQRQVHGVVPADRDDDMIIAAALESDASYIVTEDNDLLVLKQYQGIQIMNRVEFADELDRLGVP